MLRPYITEDDHSSKHIHIKKLSHRKETACTYTVMGSLVFHLLFQVLENVFYHSVFQVREKKCLRQDVFLLEFYFKHSVPENKILEMKTNE